MLKFKKLIIKSLIILCLSFVITPVVGPITNTPIVATVQAAYNKETIKDVQQTLNNFGYYCGTPDGIIGNKTKLAIKEYQKDNNLKVTGTINNSLLKSLGVTETKSSSSTNKERTVYVTESGSKYHRSSCRYLWHSKIPMKLSEAKIYYTPCSVCNP